MHPDFIICPGCGWAGFESDLSDGACPECGASDTATIWEHMHRETGLTINEPNQFLGRFINIYLHEHGVDGIEQVLSETRRLRGRIKVLEEALTRLVNQFGDDHWATLSVAIGKTPHKSPVWVVGHVDDEMADALSWARKVLEGGE